MRASLWVFAAAVLLGGCVSVRTVTAPGTDLARYHRFSFHPPANPDAAEFARSPTGQAIRREVARVLEQKGLVETTGQPEVYVACYFVVDEEETAPYASPFGPMFWAAPQTSQYLRGTVLVDLIDASSRDVVWRGTARTVASHPENPNPSKISMAVDKLMRKYPSPAQLARRPTPATVASSGAPARSR